MDTQVPLRVLFFPPDYVAYYTLADGLFRSADELAIASLGTLRKLDIKGVVQGKIFVGSPAEVEENKFDGRKGIHIFPSRSLYDVLVEYVNPRFN